MMRRFGALSVAVGLTVALATTTACGSLRIRILMNAGNKLYKAQKYEAAIEEYKKILAIDPENWSGSYQIAMSYLALYHPGSAHAKDIEFADRSIEAFEKLLTMNAPDQDTAEKVRNYYVALLRSAEKTDKAIAYYERLLEQTPGDALLLSQVAEIYAKKGDFPNALRYYEKRAEAEPDNKEAWYTVGVVCWERSYRMKEFISETEREEVIAKGMAALEKALSFDDQYTEAIAYINLVYREKAQLLANQMKHEEAGEAITKADEYQQKALAIINRRKAEAAAHKTGG